MQEIRLTKKRYAELLAAERKLLDLLPVYAQLEDCGENCDAMRGVTDTELQRIQKIKENFAPNV